MFYFLGLWESELTNKVKKEKSFFVKNMETEIVLKNDVNDNDLLITIVSTAKSYFILVRVQVKILDAAPFCLAFQGEACVQ